MLVIMKHLPTGQVRIVSLQEPAAVAELDEVDITWAIEEHGVCETDDYEITDGGGKTREGASENNIVGDTDAEKPVRVVSLCPHVPRSSGGTVTRVTTVTLIQASEKAGSAMRWTTMGSQPRRALWLPNHNPRLLRFHETPE